MGQPEWPTLTVRGGRGRVAGSGSGHVRRHRRRRFRLGDHAGKAVALSRNGVQQAGVIGVVLQRVANLRDGRIDAVVHVADNFPSPQGGEDVASRDKLAASLDEQQQQFHRKAFQAHDRARAPELVGAAVELEVFKSDDRRDHRGLRRWQKPLYWSGQLRIFSPCLNDLRLQYFFINTLPAVHCWPNDDPA